MGKKKKRRHKRRQLDVALDGPDTFVIWRPADIRKIATGILRGHGAYVISRWYGDLDPETYDRVHVMAREAVRRFQG